ncbi:MAG: 50S ribosomal protein L11 methyltransferase [Alphaproteobacteria bacterium]|nr:50S ribosomal protein L11 methyltransferase [Alphaproteobacteria bacterium]
MRLTRPLWLLTLSLPPQDADAISKAFENGSLAVTVLNAPRAETARVEVLYDRDPGLAEISMKLAVLTAALGIETPEISVQSIPKLNWLKKVAADFPPLRIARWTVHGALHRAKVPNRLYAMQIDATNAFGTGEHPTTRGCLLLLHRLLKSGFRPKRMADIGCGSGILSMAAVLGARCDAVAVDLDPDSALIAAGNARLNGLRPNIRVGHGRGYALPIVAGQAPYDLIMANIFAGPLCEMAKDLKAHLAKDGRAILSGLLNSQVNKVIAAHRMQGLMLVDKVTIGEWAALAFKRHNGAICVHDKPAILPQFDRSAQGNGKRQT